MKEFNCELSRRAIGPWLGAALDRVALAAIAVPYIETGRDLRREYGCSAFATAPLLGDVSPSVTDGRPASADLLRCGGRSEELYRGRGRAPHCTTCAQSTLATSGAGASAAIARAPLARHRTDASRLPAAGTCTFDSDIGGGR